LRQCQGIQCTLQSCLWLRESLRARFMKRGFVRIDAFQTALKHVLVVRTGRDADWTEEIDIDIGIVKSFVPAMKAAGLSDTLVQKLMHSNPFERLLAIGRAGATLLDAFDEARSWRGCGGSHTDRQRGAASNSSPLHRISGCCRGRRWNATRMRRSGRRQGTALGRELRDERQRAARRASA